MRVFVTGGAGVIGLELIPRLLSAGADVLVGDLKQEPLEFIGKVRYRHGDLNQMTVAELIAFDPEIIIHLAATFERSTESLRFWDENFYHNISLSHHIMSLAQHCVSLRRVVFASSYLIYDQSSYQFDKPQIYPISLSERDSIRPRNLTGMAKLSHEIELQFLEGFSDCKFTTVSVRIFRGYGRRSRDVISRWVRSLLRDESISVYRQEGIFDYIYAADSAEGLLRLAFCEEARGIVNLGTGNSRRVSEVVEILKKHFPHPLIEYADSDIPFEASEASTEKLERLISWRPSTSLEHAIDEIVAFEKLALQGERATTPKKKIGNVLLTSSSKKIPLLHALEKAAVKIDSSAKVIAGDIDSLAVSRFQADAFWKMPYLADIKLERFIDECHMRAISVVVPSRDGELEFWASHKDLLSEAGIAVVTSAEKAIMRCRDKIEFARYTALADLPVIPAAETPDLFLGRNMVVKERYGSGSVGIGLNLSHRQAVAHAKTLEYPIFQPYIEGEEISIDSWIARTGEVAGVVLRRRDRVISGESQVTTTFRDASLEEQAIEVVSRLDVQGPVVLQAIVSKGGLNVIECNPRFGGASTASIAVGLDSLYWSLAELIDDEFKPNFIRSPKEVRQVRMPVDKVLHDFNF